MPKNCVTRQEFIQGGGGCRPEAPQIGEIIPFDLRQVSHAICDYIQVQVNAVAKSVVT